jgi:hypothetical protein
MKIEIATISLDVENFRHAKASSEPEAIKFLLSDEKNHKVTELAEDIVEQGGLDPSSLLIVVEESKRPGRYIALEGNRRLTALKSLVTPDLAKDTPGHAKIKSLHARFLDLKITSVECVVLDRNSASIWIKRKHYIGMGGAGVLPWNAVATARSDASEGIHRRWMTALAFLENHGIDAEQIRNQIAAKTTTVDRVLSSPQMLAVLGLIFGKDGTLVAENGDEVAAVKLVNALLDAMANSSFVETKVSRADQQLEFVNNFAPLSVKKVVAAAISSTGTTIGSAAATLSSGGSGTVASGGASSGSSGGSLSAPSTGSGVTRSGPIPIKTRKMLAAAGLRISNQALNKFYGELRKLNAEKNPYIAAAIIRVFLEKSSTVFLETMKIAPPNTKVGSTWHDFEVKLKTKVDAVLKNIDPTVKNPKLISARDIANGNRDKLHTADKLNDAIHSHHSLPSYTEIITIWDRFHPYFAELFDVIEKNRKP